MSNVVETKKIQGYNVNIFIEEFFYKELKNIVKEKKMDIETHINNLIKKDLKERYLLKNGK